MHHRPTQLPDFQQPGVRPVSPPPPSARPNPWDFFATRKPTSASEVMTKRELFAAMAMQGILSNAGIDPERPGVVLHAVRK